MQDREGSGEANVPSNPDFVWPPTNTAPTPTNPYFSPGVHTDHPFAVSPEGLAYGQTTRIWRWPHPVWWDGTQYATVEVAGRADSYELLPTGPRPFGQIWQVYTYVKATNSYVWKEYYWDSENEQWFPIKWLWPVDSFNDLPIPGFAVGDAHTVIETDVPVFWNNFQWVREKHSSLNDDEPERHLPEGFLRWVSPDARVFYVSPTEIGIEPVEGGTGQVWVSGEYVAAQKSASVLNALPSLEWNTQTNSIVPAYLEPDTEYWVYLANTLSGEFVIPAMPGDDSHPATPYWDFKGKLFLSRSSDVNGYLSGSGAGVNARLVGKIQTDTTSPMSGGPYFLRELNISIISRTTSFPETYRDYSDYQVRFIDYDTLRLALLDGQYGQIYVGGNLEYLGSDFDIALSAAWIEWDDELTTKVIRRTDPLSPNSLYYIYISANVDMFNYNATNPETNRPWTSDDRDAEGNYQDALDMRLKPFLSPKAPDHGRMSEQWPGYYVRLIGKVTTDANSRFINARDLSAIRQPTLDPTDFNGLAEIDLVMVSVTSFKIAAKKGTSGVVTVGGESVQTYESDSASVHLISNTDSVYAYTEANITSPLSVLNTIKDYPNQSLYVYMANSRPCWGALAGRAFVSTQAPSNGYLSRNWPGNNARWMVTIRPDSSGEFTGSFAPESISTLAVTMDDFAVSLSTTWSSAKLNLMTPPGTVIDYAGTSIPSGWLLCDGSAVSRSEYPDLFAAIGEAWGAGDGVTTFNIPDLNAKVTIGRGDHNVGDTGGEAAHTLSVDEMPSHDHGGLTGTHVSGYAVSNPVGYFPGSSIYTVHPDNHDHTIDSQGGGQSHNNMPPYAVVTKLIRT